MFVVGCQPAEDPTIFDAGSVFVNPADLETYRVERDSTFQNKSSTRLEFDVILFRANVLVYRTVLGRSELCVVEGASDAGKTYGDQSTVARKFATRPW